MSKTSIKPGRGGARPNTGGARANSGGPRPFSGRKPRAIGAVNADLATRVDDALYALDLHISTMRNSRKPLPLRLASAIEVMNRILGKPRQAIEVRGEAKLSLDDARGLVRERHRRDVAAGHP